MSTEMGKVRMGTIKSRNVECEGRVQIGFGSRPRAGQRLKINAAGDDLRVDQRCGEVAHSRVYVDLARPTGDRGSQRCAAIFGLGGQTCIAGANLIDDETMALSLDRSVKCSD